MLHVDRFFAAAMALALAGVFIAAAAVPAAHAGVSDSVMQQARTHCEQGAAGQPHVKTQPKAFCGCFFDAVHDAYPPADAAVMFKAMAATAPSGSKWPFDRHLHDAGGVSAQHAKELRGGMGATLGHSLKQCATANAPSGDSQASNTAQPSVCTGRDCFEKHLAACQSAQMDTPRTRMGQARYRILEQTDGGRCRVEMTYLDNPNPDWVGKPLDFTVQGSGADFRQVMRAMQSCLTGDGGDHDCGGSLYEQVHGTNAAYDQAENQQSRDVSSPPCGQAVADTGEPLYALPKNGRWGFVNRAGEWVIKPQWSQVGPFSEGRAVVGQGYSRGSVWGIIDRNGHTIVKPTIHADYTSGPRVPVPPIKSFASGCAAVLPEVGTSNHHAYFVTRDGHFWLRKKLPDALAGRKIKEFGSFSDGLAWFRIIDMMSDKEYGYIDTQGQVAIEVKYAHAGNFMHGLAPAAIHYGHRDHWGYINPKGELVWPHKWRLIGASEFSEGLADVGWKSQNTVGKSGYFDGDKIAIDTLHFDPPRQVDTKNGQRTFDKAPLVSTGPFTDGLAPILTTPDTKPWTMPANAPIVPERLYYMNTDGKAVLVPHDVLGVTICNAVSKPQFHHGLARLRIANKNGKCDRPTKIAGERFETYKQSHYVYIDTKARIVLEEPFRPGDDDPLP